SAEAFGTPTITTGTPVYTASPSGGYNMQLGAHAFAAIVAPGTVSLAAAFDEMDIISGKWAAGDQIIINRCIFSVQYDRPTASFHRHYVYSFNDSIAKYGVRPALMIKSQGIGGCGGTADLGALDQRALNIGIRFADPPAQLELTLFY